MESSQKFVEFAQTIHQYYSQKKQKIFKKDIWEGIPPFSQQHINKNINNKHNKYVENITVMDLRAILPSTIYPQSTMNPNNFTYICNNHLYPYSAIGLVIYETEGLTRYCTGSLIYKNIVLTSSICCYNYQLKLPTQNLYFVVGCWSCGGSSLQKIKVVASHYKKQDLCNQDQTMGIIKQTDKQKDSQIGSISNQIAILQLQKSLQKECGYFGILFRSKQQQHKFNQVQEHNNNAQKQFNNQKVYISGFAEIGEGQKNMYVNSSKLEQLQVTQDNLIKHSINTSYGQTGSPMYIYDQSNCKWYIIGIHLGKQQNTFNSQIGIRLTAQLRFQINNWIVKRKGQLDLSFRVNGYNKRITFNNLRYLATVDIHYLIGLSLNHQNVGSLGLSELSCNLWTNINWLQLRSSKLNNKSIGHLIRCKWPQLSRLSLYKIILTKHKIKSVIKVLKIYQSQIGLIWLSYLYVIIKQVFQLARDYINLIGLNFLFLHYQIIVSNLLIVQKYLANCLEISSLYHGYSFMEIRMGFTMTSCIILRKCLIIFMSIYDFKIEQVYHTTQFYETYYKFKHTYKMWAAPTAQSDFSILISFRKLNWKQKLIFLQQLNSSLAQHTNPSQIQICFLGLLEEKNINVLAKVLKLIRSYIKLYSMSLLSFREFTSNMLSFNSHLLATDDILVQFIQLSVHSHQQIDQVLKGLEDIININPSVDAILKMMNFMITSTFNMHVLTNTSFEKCIIYCFSPAHTANITDAQSLLLKNIVDLIGNNSILLGRKLKLSTIYINRIKQYVSLQIEQKRDCSNEIQINYIYELTSQQWLQDYKIISMKCICLSLKQALLQDNYKNIQINFSFRLLESLSWLSHRKNKNINKYIYDIVGCSINRNAILTSQQLLLQILFQALGDKRISKRLKEQEITYKQQMWIGLANQTYIQAKIKQVNNQQEYHRLIILLGILKARNLMDIKALCEDLQQKQNLSNTYRIQLQQLSKT